MKPCHTLICAALLALPALPTGAHPHIFVDTGLRLLLDDQGRVSDIEVTWSYDELYSLLILEDMGLDEDYDGVLTQAELTQLSGFDMNWDPGFEGDLYIQTSEGPVTLSAPVPLSTHVAEGKITTLHRRHLAQPLSQFELRAYDPTFYTAYDVTGGVAATDCTVTRRAADLDAAYAAVEQKMTEKAYAEDDYPAVGDIFADTFEVTCPTR